MTKHSCPVLLEDRAAVWRRWKSYVKHKPNKYRIVHSFLKASHKTYLQEFKAGCNCNPKRPHTCTGGEKWVFIERLPTWYFEFKTDNLKKEVVND